MRKIEDANTILLPLIIQGIAVRVAGIGCIEVNKHPFRHVHVRSRVCDRCAVDQDLESVLIGIAKVIGHHKRDLMPSGIKDLVKRSPGAEFHPILGPLVRLDFAVGVAGSGCVEFDVRIRQYNPVIACIRNRGLVHTHGYGSIVGVGAV